MPSTKLRAWAEMARSPAAKAALIEVADTLDTIEAALAGTEGEPQRPDMSRCPIGKIVDIYHEICPESPRVLSTTALAPDLRARWKEDRRHQNLGFWRSYFGACREQFWYRDTDGRGYPAMRTFLRKKNFYAVINGEYSG